MTAKDISTILLRHSSSHKKGQLKLDELARVCDISRITVHKYLSHPAN